MTISRAAASAVALLSTVASGCVVTSERDATLTVENDSSYLLTEVYLARDSDPRWGPNLVPNYLYPGEAVIAYDLPCAYYDVLVVDETDLACTLYGLHLCFSDGTWYVTDATLDACDFPKRLVPSRPDAHTVTGDAGVGL